MLPSSRRLLGIATSNSHIMSDSPPVCDYEGSDYQARFWENQGREYEDRVERIALRRLMPAGGGTLIDVGAGFGRLANEYGGVRDVSIEER